MARQGRDSERDRRLLRAARRGDSRARESLVTSHLQLVRSVVNRYRNLGLPFDDLLQEGVVGLLDAIARYDFSARGDFDTFARFRVRRTIRNALTDQSRLVRLPKHVVERRRALSRVANGRVRSADALAAATGLSVRAVADALAAEVVPASLDAIASADVDPAAPDPEAAALERDAMERLGGALEGLHSRQREIVSRTFGLDGAPQPLSVVAAEIGLSRERTRSILRDALAELRADLDAVP